MRKVTPRDAFLVHDPADAYLAQAVVERFEAGGVTMALATPMAADHAANVEQIRLLKGMIA